MDETDSQGEQLLRGLVNSIANELCRAVDGSFDFTVSVETTDQTVEKLQMLVNWVLDAARRSLLEVGEKNRQAKELLERRLAAEAASTAKSEFLALVSHEIRTPMTAILGFAEVLKDERGDSEQRLSAVEAVHRNATYLMCIINDILDLSRIEAGRITIERERTPAFSLFQETLDLVRVRAEEAGLRLIFDYLTPIPEFFQTDPTRLRQILINLIGNAIKFTSEGEVRLTVSLLGEPAEAPRLQIDVSDTGIGMSEEQAAGIFEPFTQGDASMARRFGGTGLGLTISARLACLLGGQIDLVRTAPGAGSIFRLTIPTGPLAEIALLHEAPVRDRRSGGARSPDSGSLRGRLLVAEDSADNRRLIMVLLGDTALELSFVENGKEAVERTLKARELGRPFDAILMDMQMPILDGYQATAKLRELGFEGPILALTAHAMHSDRDRCLEAGCNDFATKPILRAALVELLSRYLGT